MADAGGGFDWGHALSAFGGGAITAIGAAIGWIYRAGAKEPTLRKDFDESLIAAERRVESKIEAAEMKAETKLEELVAQFHDTFSAMRQKITDVEMDVVRNYVAKPDFDEFRKEFRDVFREFREEYREGFADFKTNIAHILGGKP
jgi:hypothetical protein